MGVTADAVQDLTPDMSPGDVVRRHYLASAARRESPVRRGRSGSLTLAVRCYLRLGGKKWMRSSRRMPLDRPDSSRLRPSANSCVTSCPRQSMMMCC
jgi:hypothetical protein